MHYVELLKTVLDLSSYVVNLQALVYSSESA
jgi:hypothetical protein